MGKGGFGKGKGGKGKGKFMEPEGPPDRVEKVGVAMHPCEDQLIVKCTHSRVPQFNARIFLQNKEEIGKLDEIFGPINEYMFSVKMSEGMKASSFKESSELYIDPMKTLAFDRFLPQNGGGGKGGKGKGKGKGGDKGKGKGKGKGGGKSGKGPKGVQKGGAFTGRGGKGK